MPSMFAAKLACLPLVLAACAGSGFQSAGASSEGSPSPATQPRPATTMPAPASPGAASPSIASTFCPGRTWPPHPLGGVPGITAVSTDRATVQITNGTDRTYYYRVSGWEPVQFETCRAWGELERQRGPILPGAAESVMVDTAWRQAGIRVTIAFWEQPCGEACAVNPVAAMVVDLSPVEPASS